MSELITLKKTELLSLLRQAYEQGWLGFRELAESEADYLLEEYLKKNPGNTYSGGGCGGGPMPPPMSSYVSNAPFESIPESAGVGRDSPYIPNMEIGDMPMATPDIGITISSGSYPENVNVNGNVYNSNGFTNNGFSSRSSVSSSSLSSSREFQGILRTPTIQDHLNGRTTPLRT